MSGIRILWPVSRRWHLLAISGQHIGVSYTHTHMIHIAMCLINTADQVVLIFF